MVRARGSGLYAAQRLPIAPSLLELLACPACHGPLRAGDPWACGDCPASYPIRDGFANLVTAEHAAPGAQESGWQRWSEAMTGLRAWRDRRRSTAKNGQLRSDGVEETARRSLVERAGHRGVVVDVGAFDGGKHVFTAADARYVGVDPMPAAAALPERACVVRGFAEALPVATGVADTILSFAAFDYYVDGAGALREMARVLKPGGALAMIVSVVAPEVARARGGASRAGRLWGALAASRAVGPAGAVALAHEALTSPARAHTHYYTRDQVLGLVGEVFTVEPVAETAQATSTIVYLVGRRR